MFNPDMSLRQVIGLCGNIQSQLEEALPGAKVNVVPDIDVPAG